MGLNIDYPGDRSTVSKEFTVKITATSTKKITEVKMWVDGTEKKTWTEKPYEIVINDLSDGPHTLKFKAVDKDGNSAEKESKIGVNTAWDYTAPTPTLAVPTSTPASTGTTISPTGTITP